MLHLFPRYVLTKYSLMNGDPLEALPVNESFELIPEAISRAVGLYVPFR